MKRLVLLLLGVVLAWPRGAGAQLTMQMPGGWTLQFAGNVNAFWVFTSDEDGPSNSSIRTGLLPTFATFSAKGREAGLDLGIHFGFAPQIQNAGTHDQFVPGAVQAGAQIDMRQVFLTVGLKGGHQILAGRELGVFQRQNILNDMTLYGVGAVGDPQGGGTTLGRIGYGYIYPNFNAQVTYTSPANRSVQVSIGAFQPSVVDVFTETATPRLEGELVWKSQPRPPARGQRASPNKFMVWVGGEWQNAKDPATDETLSSVGGTAGVRADLSNIAIVVSAYTGKGIGHVLGLIDESVSGNGEGRPADGGYAQVTYTSGKTTLGASYGVTRLKGADDGAGGDVTDELLSELQMYTAGIYYQWTRSLKVVGEVSRERNDLSGGANRTNVSGGLMLFF